MGGRVSVSPMTFADLLDAVRALGVDALAGFDRDALIAAGVDPARVRALAGVHEVYFGPTRFRAQQRLGVEAARAGGHSLDKLVLIERYMAHIDDAAERWRVRRELLSVRGSYAALRRAAQQAAPAPERPAGPDRVRFSRTRGGKRSLTVVGSQRRMADLEHALMGRAPGVGPAGEEMYDALWELLDPAGDAGAGAGAGGVAAAVPRPLLLIPLASWVRIMRGEGDDTVLGLSDATTMTGAEFLNQVVATGAFELEAALFHPQEGAVNLYRTARFANQKQRDLARAVTPVCPVPGCRHGAEACEIHHIQAWKHGGETNLANLVPVCRYHNRINDDDQPVTGRSNGRGRIDTAHGRPTWVSPRGYPAKNPHHAHYGAMEQLFGTDPPPD